MNTEQMIDRLYQNFVVEQAVQCVGARGCMYTHLDEERRGCAIGCLLPANIAESLDRVYIRNERMSTITSIMTEDIEDIREYNESEVVTAVEYTRKYLADIRLEELGAWQLAHDTKSIEEFRKIITVEWNKQHEG